MNRTGGEEIMEEDYVRELGKEEKKRLPKSPEEEYSEEEREEAED